MLSNRLRRELDAHLTGSDFAAYHGVNVIHRRKVWIPDLVVAPRDLDEIPDEDDLGVTAAGVAMVVEVVSPGHRNIVRDRDRKRREYARAGIPLYVLIDDHDGEGTVTILADPTPGKAAYADEHRVAYGTEATIPDGPAKGYTIGETITRP
ncbi:Uma2 family endonuclease [Streptomyces sp. NPDC093109]|uniref:Uma2 family endonuclease n=1 Tax=Streptomyces sp. NPDC093109 TaxID=3154977 RepID=UPI00344E47E8